MAFLGRGNKADLQQIAIELGVQNVEALKVIDLKKAILAAEGYEEEFIEGYLNSVIEERKKKDELRKKEMEFELEERKRKQEIEFELEKIRLENERISKGGVQTEINEKPRIKLHNIIQKFDPKTCDICLYLVLFERQVKKAEIKKEYWVSHLIGLLPYEIVEIIARESEEIGDDYEKTKELLLKRFKLTPEKFRQLFTKHTKRAEITWRDFAFELKNYFNEWIRGLEVKTFEELCDLIVTDQIKRKTPPEIKEHFFDEWSLFKSSEVIAEKLDDYDNLKTTFPKKCSEASYTRNWKPPFRKPNFGNNVKEDEKMFTKRQYEQKDARQKFSCFACGKEGHMKKSCPKLNTGNQVPGRTSRNDLEKKGLNEVCVNLSNTSFDWEIPVGETDGELLKVDLGIGNQKFQGIVDSGAEITVLRKSIVPEEYLHSGGKIFLRPAIGNPVEAKLVSVPLSLRTEENFIPYVQVHAAVVEGLHEEALITPKVFSWLKEQNRKYLGDEVYITPVNG